ncbi:MAG: DUF1947 domain-containing protein [Candidatus Bathyarchaeota archaeon]|nr:DUF1947 domain-containing protein [Candidatus Bathyarchaeota archaeon]
MPLKKRRYALKTKEAKQMLDDASEKLKVNLEDFFGAKVNVEVIETDIGAIYLVDRKPVLYRMDERILPTLFFAEFVARAPKLVVDMGAVPFICKGAAVMAPGVVQVEGQFGVGDFVIVVDVKFRKPLALGESLLDAQSMKGTKKGPVAKTLHYVSDKVWSSIKSLGY